MNSLQPFPLDVQPDDGLLEAETCSWLAVTIVCYIYIYMYIYIIKYGCVWTFKRLLFNPLNAELNPICYLLALLGAHHFLHVSRIRVNFVLLTNTTGMSHPNVMTLKYLTLTTTNFCVLYRWGPPQRHLRCRNFGFYYFQI